jgi:5-hydroxyisourate hydrolase-like protein (transthyretin family)
LKTSNSFLLRLGGLLALLVPFASACDPCFGVAACGATQIRYEGTLVRAFDGGPAEGIRVEFQRTGGGQIEPAVIVAHTDSAGHFRLVANADPQQVEGTLRFFFGETLPVDSVAGVVLASTRSSRDLRHLGRWVIPYPHFETVGNLFFRATGEPAQGVEVEFRRTGGVRVAPEIHRVTSDAFGNFSLRLGALELGEVVGDLIIRPAAPLTSRTVENLRFSSTLSPTGNALVGRFGLGPHLPFLGRAIWNDTGEGAAGIEVRITRTGGIAVEPNSYVTQTNAFGAFNLDPRPLAAGVVTFELVFRSPGSQPYATYEFTVATSDDDVSHVLRETWVIPRP